jgi:hypothetical protein
MTFCDLPPSSRQLLFSRSNYSISSINPPHKNSTKEVMKSRKELHMLYYYLGTLVSPARFRSNKSCEGKRGRVCSLQEEIE